MTAGLVVLPNEILDAIVVHLDRASLAALSRSCKKLYSIGTIYLYSVIECDFDEDPAYPLDSLLRGVFVKLENALQVKVLRLTGGTNHATEAQIDWDTEEQERLEALVLRVAEAASDARKDPQPLKYVHVVELLTLEPPPVLVASIVSRLQNLTTLDIGARFLTRSEGADGTTFGSLLSFFQQQNHDPLFPRLRQAKLGADIRFRNIFGDDTYLDEKISPELALGHAMSVMLSQPKLTSLETTFSYGEDLSGIHANPSLPPSPLKKLTLRHSEARVSTLTSLLALTPCLEELRYEICHDIGYWQARSEHGRRSMRQLSRGLQHVRATLKLLEVKAAWYSSEPGGGYMESRDYFGFDDSLESLKDFAALTHVELPILFAWGLKGLEDWEAMARDASTTPEVPTLKALLPPNIEVLCLRDDGWQWDSAEFCFPFDSYSQRLANNLRGRREWATRLMRFVNKANGPEYRWRHAIHAICASAGIEDTLLWRALASDDGSYL